MKLIIDIPEGDYKFIKDLQSPIVGGRGNCKTIQENVINAIKNGTPLLSVTNAEEAEAYPINQEENCKIVCDFLRDITGIDIRNLIKEAEND